MTVASWAKGSYTHELPRSYRDMRLARGPDQRRVGADRLTEGTSARAQRSSETVVHSDVLYRFLFPLRWPQNRSRLFEYASFNVIKSISCWRMSTCRMSYSHAYSVLLAETTAGWLTHYEGV